MFETNKSKPEKEDEYVIRHKPNRIILFLEQTKWYWPTIFLITVLTIYIILNPSSTDQTNAPTSVEGTIILVLILIAMVFLPLYIGIKLGANLYRPQESNLTKKQLKIFDELLGKSDNIKVEFIKKDGKIMILGKEEES